MNIEELKKFKKILVTGPQRSGTTIAGHMIAKDLNYKYYDERDVGVRSCTQLFKVLSTEELAVIQGPCFCSMAHWIDSPDTAVVMMLRNIEDIRASEARINWPEEKAELKNYFLDSGIISAVRYENWEKYQKPNMQVPYFELDYNSLSSHPMWLEKESRKNFRREFTLEQSNSEDKDSKE